MQHEWVFPTKDCRYAYENTLPGSALRKFLVDDAVENFRFTDLSDPKKRAPEFANYPKHFLGDVVAGFMALGSRPIPSSAGYGNMPAGQDNWGKYIKPLVCSRYHDHPSPPSN